MFTVNVSPDMGMYHLLRSQGYEPAYALAEFVDNAIQAHFSRPRAKKKDGPLQVEIDIFSDHYGDPSKRNSIRIRDTGPGITKARLSDAMKPAHPSPTKGLSEFGIGMKAAAVWFTDTWSLSTIPSSDKVHLQLHFDLPELIASGKDAVRVHERASADPQGTIISLTNLRRPVDSERFQQICADLRDIYQRFTSGEDPRVILFARYDDAAVSLKFDANVDRTILQAREYKTVSGQLYAIGRERPWTVAVDTVFHGAQISGFICLTERGSYVDNPGLVLFRGERVIQGTKRRPNLPPALFRTGNKYSRQRVYGQLFVDGLPVTYTKDAFEIDEDAFARHLASLDGMESLLRQAEEYRVNATPKEVQKASDIPGPKRLKAAPPPATTSTPSKPPPGNSGLSPPSTSAPPSTDPAAGKPPRAPPPVAPLIALFTELKPKAGSIALRSIVDETIWQCRNRRDISTALCLRIVLEISLLERIQRDFNQEYPKVSEKAVASLLNYLHSNETTFFDKKADHKVTKCLQSIAQGHQGDVVLLNNTAHGHYQPTLAEINQFVLNLESLLRWAFS